MFLAPQCYRPGFLLEHAVSHKYTETKNKMFSRSKNRFS